MVARFRLPALRKVAAEGELVPYKRMGIIADLNRSHACEIMIASSAHFCCMSFSLDETVFKGSP